jgi:hypothetical protein
MKNNEYYLGHISDDPENLRDMLLLTRQDLNRAGMAQCHIDKIANCEDNACIEIQRNKLLDRQTRCIGAFALKIGNLVGFSRIGEWLASDQLPYSQGIDYLTSITSLVISKGILSGEPYGIHELVVDDIADDKNGRKKVIDMLLVKAIEIAESREVRLIHYNDRVVLDSINDHGFEKTKRYHGTDTGLRQLFIRPPYIPSLKELVESCGFEISKI